MKLQGVKIIAFHTISIIAFRYFMLVEKTVVYIINRKIHGCLEITDLFLVFNIIFQHPCIILYLNDCLNVIFIFK